jgi:hypothetical protein
MEFFSATLTTEDGQPLGHVEGQIQFNDNGRVVNYTGAFEVPAGDQPRVQSGATLLLDIDGGRHLRISIRSLRVGSSSPSAVAEFVSNGIPLR